MSGLRVGFVGIGNMGWPMAKHVLDGGFALTVFDVDAERVRRFAAETGAGGAESGTALAAAADIVITMLPTGAVVREALLGTGGIARSLARGAVVVDMSSSDPNGTRALGAALGELGVALVDAPVSGGVRGAEAATLAIMIGGADEAAVTRVSPMLATMGAKLFRTGPLGSGHAMKALNNYVAAAAFAATSEALLVGERFGLEPAVMVQVLNASSGRSFHTDLVFPEQVVGGKFAAGFAIGLMAKDVGIAAALAREIGVDSPLCQLTSGRWDGARDALGAAADFTAAYKHWAARGG
jgi:3-hydroxyisobutyrate dehydrogenase